MKMGCKFTYISKRKMEMVKKSKGGAACEEAYDSDEEVDMDEANDFMAEEEEAPAPMPGAAAAPKPKAKREKKKSAEESKHRVKQEVDTNVIEIQLGTLEHAEQLATGEPVFCSKCGAVLSLNSRPLIVKDAASGKSIWTCEFCNGKNELVLDEEEIPKTDTLTYIMEKVAPPAVKQDEPMKDVAAKEPVPKDDDISVIFCIDVSGSMDAAKFVKEGKAMKYVKNKSYPTRLEGVKVAIDNQIERMTKESPNRKVGFVTFENKVVLIGDGTKPPVAFEGAKLDSNFFSLLEEAVNYNGTHLNQTIGETNASLLSKLQTIRTGGSTALGPGLIVSLALAGQGKPGSKVIICTDGLANKGCGSVEDVTEKAAGPVREFYNQAAEYAKQHGVSVSLMTLVESECRLDMLAPVANLTGGDILRVDPMKLSNDFSAFLEEKVIATNVVVKVKIHKGLQFRNEPEKYLSADKTTLTKEAGNATRGSLVSFEYCMKRPHELATMTDVDWDKLVKIPFQSQISYRTPDGRKCLKVITRMQEVTHEKEEAKKTVDAQVIGAHAAVDSAQWAEKGDYTKAKTRAYAFAGLSAAAPAQMREVRSHVKGLYGAIQMQEAVHAPQMDGLTMAINRAYNAKK